jgi:hypothetical protein
MNRRSFLKVTATAGVVYGISPAQALESPRTVILFDERYGDAQQFAQATAQICDQILPTRQDVVRLWFDGLAELVAKPDTRIMGLTTHSDMEVLQSCLAGARLRLRRAQFHNCRDGSVLMSWLFV